MDPQNRLPTSGENPLLEKHPYLSGYGFIISAIVLVFASHLDTFAISFLFLYLVSDVITNDIRRHVRLVPKAVLFSFLYLAVITLFFIFAYNIIPTFIKQLPKVATQLQDQAIHQYERLDARLNLAQYVNPEQVREAIVGATRMSIGFIAKKAPPIYIAFFYFIMALVLNLLLYHDRSRIDRVFSRKPQSLMGFLYGFCLTRLKLFYYYFKKVMVGQLIISAINTAISAVLIIMLDLPRPLLLICTVFICGLFPIVGNLVSNTIVTLTALVSSGAFGAMICLGLLVVIHKLEYFLNSKIIGDIVHLPMVVTLASLIVCEVMLGIIGLIVAIPLVLYVRHELERIPGLPPAMAEHLIDDNPIEI